MSDGRVRRRLALGALQLFLLTTASLSPAAVARAQDDTEPPALTLETGAPGVTTFSAVGEVIEYTYLLTNTGGVALDAVSVTDTMVEDVLCQSGPLEPGGSLACTGSYAITQDDLDAGSVTNIALGEGTYGGSEVVASEEAGLTITALAPGPPALTLQMEADPTTFSAVGEEIEYTYLLTNTGGVALDAVSVTDTMVEDVLCQSGPLEPGGSLACTGAYAITQDDLDAGSVTNSAQGHGTYGDGEEVASEEAGLTIAALAPEPPGLRLEMQADRTTYSAVGEAITYTYELTNTGGVTLGDLTVIPSLGPVTCPSEPLEPGGSVGCVFSYAITQDDLDAGSITNTARASGTHGGGEGVASDEASLTITALAPEPPALTLEMEAIPTTFSAVGEAITYDLRLTNTGGVALDAVSVTHTMVDDVTCESGPLEPGRSYVCGRLYTITQADLDAGSVTNSAQGHGTYGDGEEVASEEASLTIAALAPEPPGLRLEMQADRTTYSAVGEAITYTYELTNTGGVTLGDLTVIPSLGPVTCPSEPLEPGGSVGCVFSYAITQDDLDAGSITNTARASGTHGGGEGVASDEASLTITALAPEPPALTLEMEAIPTTFSAVGEAITYDLRLTNTGGVALDAVSVTHTMVDDVTCESGPLEPGRSYVCGRLYTITQADLDAGSVTNSAQGHGTYGDGEEVASEEASLTIAALAPEPPVLRLEMGAEVLTSDAATYSAVGEVLGYAYVLTNTGGVTLDAVSVTDDFLRDVACPPGPLEPGGTLICLGNHTITQADLDLGSITNRAQASGTYGQGEEVASEEASLTIAALAPEPPVLRLEMGAEVLTSDAATYSAVGEVLGYAYVLTNTGGVTLDAVSVTDDFLRDVACPPGPLEPGGTLICLGNHTITQADLDLGSITNRAQASGTYGQGEEVASEEASLTIAALAPEPPVLRLEMGAEVLTSDAATYSAVGEVLGYAYVLTNTGGVTLDAVSVTDDFLRDVACPPGPLEPGGTLICLGNHTITQADLDLGSITNRAQASGTYGQGEEVASEEASFTLAALAPEPAGLRLEMGVEEITFGAVRDVIHYEYVLTNTGGVALDAVSVTATTVGVDVTCPPGPLEPGGSLTCLDTYLITQADLDAGSVTNRAQAHGLYGGSEGVASDEASLTITAATGPAALTLEMGADVTTFSAVDEIIVYSYELTNTGGVALDAVSVTNTKVVGDIICPSGPLEPGGSLPCLGVYRITQADLDAGSVTNVAQAHGLYGGSEAVASDEASLTFAAVSTEPAALALEMGADPTTFGAVDEIIVYTYKLTNTGGVALDAVSVTDTELGDVPCPSGSLEPGGSLICHGVLLTSQDDLDAGSVTNRAQAQGTYGGGEAVASEEASLTIAAVSTEPAALRLEMAADVTTFGAIGDLIEYDYRLTNTGGVALGDLTVIPSLGPVACPTVPLEPGGSVVCSFSYHTTQADLDAGSVTNRAQGFGTYGGGEGVASEEASLTIAFLAPEPAALRLEMAADVTTFGAIGDLIEYDYRLTNTGGVAVGDLSVTDTIVGDVACPTVPLEPGGSVVCSFSYHTTQADLDAGSVTNRAQGFGTYGGSEGVASEAASLTIAFLAPEPPVLTLVLVPGPATFSAVGEVITYEYRLANTGGVTVDDLSVTDTIVGDVACPSNPLEPDGSLACVGSYTITQADLDAGSVTNRAQASGTYGGSEEVASDETSLTIDAVSAE